MDEIICKELVELVTEYLDNTLPDERRILFEEHITRCEGCRNYLDHMRKTIQLAGKIPLESLTPSDKERLLNLFRNWNQSR
jgi:anti-sigma factor RsiW